MERGTGCTRRNTAEARWAGQAAPLPKLSIRFDGCGSADAWSLAGNWHNILKGKITLTQNPLLSKREQEVVNLLLEGKSNKLIASSLSISERTVEFHLKNIYAKFQVNSRMELVLKLGKAKNSLEAEKLRQSTVAGEGEVAENRDGLSLWNWATSLRQAVSKFSKEFIVKSSLNSNVGAEGKTMTFYEAIRVCFIKYAEFSGRASRSEFWWFTLFVILVGGALQYLNQSLSSIFLIAMLLPFLAAGTRRLRDSGQSGWWQLFLLAPVAGIIVLGILWAQPPTSPPQEDTPPA
ncbi:Inner membrane protein YhaI [Anaerolineales bacterium]|nr:Inner membrane protein YhaI [Anaerolineales bacterium]